MRFVDRGELIAQANLIRLEKLNTGERTSLERFQDDIKSALGKNFGQFERAGEKTTEQNYVIYRVIASGKAEGLPIQWRYYLISAPDGQRLSAVFTLEEELSEKFAETDKLIVESLRLLEQPTATAAAKSATNR